MKKKNRIRKNAKFVSLKNLVLEFIYGVDDEMEHGDYHVPDCVPYKYEDEEGSYYENHNRIINKVTNTRQKIAKLIGKDFI